MNTAGYTPIKFIIISGVIVFFLLLSVSFMLQQGIQSDEMQRVARTERDAATPFNAARAWEHVELLHRSDAAGEQIVQLLHAMGLKPEKNPVTMDGKPKKKPPYNIMVTIEGQKTGRILIISPYPSDGHADDRPAGVNTTISGAAVLLELANTLGLERKGPTLQLVWLAGVGTNAEGLPVEGLPGAQSLVAQLKKEDALKKVRAVINVYAIGDCYFRIYRDPKAPPWLADLFWNSARQLGYGLHFVRAHRNAPGCQEAFYPAGIPAINLIDYEYGGNPIKHPQFWQTDKDTLEKNCPESLQAVGDVLYNSLESLDLSLKKPGR